MGEDCLLLLVRGLGSSGSLKWQSNLEHSTVQWVRLAALLWHGRSFWPGQQRFCKRLENHRLSELHFGGERTFYWKSLARRSAALPPCGGLPLHLRTHPKATCCCPSSSGPANPTASVPTSISLVSDCPPCQKGLWILNFNLGWCRLAGYELLYLQITSRGPTCLLIPPQYQTHEPSTTLGLDSSSPSPASLTFLPLCSLGKGRLRPKTWEEKAEPEAGQFG